jgi:hypothetical protein
MNYQKKAIEHFRLSIVDAKLAYTLFKSLYLSRSDMVAGKDLAEKYLWTQKQHANFFTIIEYCSVTTFIIKILHGFDEDYKERSLTLRDIDKNAYDNFVDKKNNKEVLEKIRTIRHKRVAHFDKTVKIDQDLPSFEKIDMFFNNLENFYNGLTHNIENSTTRFDQDKNLKDNLDEVMQNLYRGEKIRLLEIELKWDWKENDKNISRSSLI